MRNINREVQSDLKAGVLTTPSISLRVVWSVRRRVGRLL